MSKSELFKIIIFNGLLYMIMSHCIKTVINYLMYLLFYIFYSRIIKSDSVKRFYNYCCNYNHILYYKVQLFGFWFNQICENQKYKYITNKTIF